ncbi:hypothetical protein KUL49_09680 [Alteromonas sp. KUL49]|nr:hypothetical protein KUL49_09680 [Alteromonas sp. KUL49]
MASIDASILDIVVAVVGYLNFSMPVIVIKISVLLLYFVQAMSWYYQLAYLQMPRYTVQSSLLNPLFLKTRL